MVRFPWDEKERDIIPKYLYSIVLIAISVFLSGCRLHNSQQSFKSHIITKNEALTEAKSTLKKEGLDCDRYIVYSIDEELDQWIISFRPKGEIRPLGGEVFIWVDKADGKIKLMRGE